METFRLALEIVLGIAGIVVAGGVPLFIFQFKLFRDDMREMKMDVIAIGNKLDSHISNYDIHKVD